MTFNEKIQTFFLIFAAFSFGAVILPLFLSQIDSFYLGVLFFVLFLLSVFFSQASAKPAKEMHPLERSIYFFSVIPIAIYGFFSPLWKFLLASLILAYFSIRIHPDFGKMERVYDEIQSGKRNQFEWFSLSKIKVKLTGKNGLLIYSLLNGVLLALLALFFTYGLSPLISAWYHSMFG